jgi:hypothetical protein
LLTPLEETACLRFVFRIFLLYFYTGHPRYIQFSGWGSVGDIDLAKLGSHVVSEAFLIKIDISIAIV